MHGGCDLLDHGLLVASDVTPSESLVMVVTFSHFTATLQRFPFFGYSEHTIYLFQLRINLR